MRIPDATPLDPTQRQRLATAFESLSREQLFWLSGFLAGQLSAAPAHETAAAAAVAAPPAARPRQLTVLYGTESGNSEGLAMEAKRRAEQQGLKPTLWNMADIEPNKLAGTEDLLVIVSTWGEGDPPSPIEDFHGKFMSDTAPRLEGTRFSVLALGDTSYEHFCKIGKDYDKRLAELGAERIHPRTDCDVDFEEPFVKWIDGALAELMAASAPSPAAVASNGSSVNMAAGLTTAATAVEPLRYDKKNPFPSRLKEKVLLNGRGSTKETYHYEFDLEGSGLQYIPGDSLALTPRNDPKMVELILGATGLNPDAKVSAPDGDEVPLHEALLKHYDITGASTAFLKKWNALAKNDDLSAFLEPDRKEALKDLLWGRQIIDMIEAFPVEGLTAAVFTGALRKLPPRLYSIASSQKAHPDEVHLTVATVRYHTHGRQRGGVASTFLADHLGVGEATPVFIHTNKNFRLPEDPATPIIMVGPGTGIAPFRAFIEERAATGATGKNWLFFGDQRFLYDFLYQTEWQDYKKRGLLERIDLAFSRDQAHKVYVQHRITEQGADLYRWLMDGAYFYVCGDASRMAGDVHNALLQVAQTFGGHGPDSAEDWLKQLKKEKRYQRDVY